MRRKERSFGSAKRDPLNRMNIYLNGNSTINWSTDQDYQSVRRVLEDLGCNIRTTAFSARIIYSVWWNNILNKKYLFWRALGKRIIATITNDLSHQSDELRLLRKIASDVVYANAKQKLDLERNGFNTAHLFYSPFYIDESVFRPNYRPREDMAKLLGIPQDIIKNRILIGSFQRDTLGNDLTRPKWQKDPDLLLNIIEFLAAKLPICLILAGPRRHYVLNQCCKLNIPHFFIGDRAPISSMKDDITINLLPAEKMNILYNLVDLYIVSSKSEGGPKAVIESALTMTPIISTDVGLAPDFLDPFCIYKGSQEAQAIAFTLLNDSVVREQIVTRNYATARTLNNYGEFKKRIENILGKN